MEVTPITADNPLAGHCFCNAIEYTISAPPLNVYICHCLDCRRFSGTAFCHNALFDEAALKILQPPKDELDQALTMFGDKENGYRQFCAKCGSPLFMTAGGMPGKIIVAVGTVDGSEKDERFKPAAQGWCKRRDGWLGPVEGGSEFDEW